MGAAARVTDTTDHGSPLNGAGCTSVLIGRLAAWRAVVPATGPPGALTPFLSAQTVARTAIETAEAATAAAILSGVPGAAPAAKTAEETVKATAAATMATATASLVTSMTASAGSPPDVITCPVPLPIPPHGPGVVVSGSKTVFIGGFAAARTGDPIVEAVGPPNKISTGDRTVLIG